MAERFENLDNILPDWAKEDIQKSLVDARYKKQEEEKRPFLFMEMTRAVRLSRKSSKIKSKTKPLFCLGNTTSSIDKMTMTLIYLNNSQSENHR